MSSPDTKYLCLRGTGITGQDIIDFMLFDGVSPEGGGPPAQDNPRYELVFAHLVTDRELDHDRGMVLRKLLSKSDFRKMYHRDLPKTSIRCSACLRLVRWYERESASSPATRAEREYSLRLFRVAIEVGRRHKKEQEEE